LADLVLPNHTPLESWGDRVTRPGVRSLQQPTFRPLKDTRATPDVLWATAKQAGIEGGPSGDFQSTVKAAWADAGSFHDLLQTGGVFADTGESVEVFLADDLKIELDAPLVEGDGEFTLLPVSSPLLGDGSGANLPWLQEIADPVTKLTWKSYVEISKNTARSLSVSHGDIVTVTTSAGAVETPVYVRGGIMDNVIALATGQGHTVGHYASDREAGTARGVNVNDLLPAEAVDEDGGRAWLTVKASLATTGESTPPGFIIKSDNKRGRDLGEVVELSSLIGDHQDEHHEGGNHAIKEFDATFDSDEKSPYRWGMTIDLDKCTGCSACVAACYTENNIPVVEETETIRGRNMDWIRIERWMGEGDTNSPNVVTDPTIENRWGNEEVGNNDIRHNPMTCQHCGAAPCEQVCPVIGTYHNGEGLNVMVYNRCVGTRYCGNNCSYKVRKFNFWDFSHLNWPGDLSLMLNPDVTVRGRGVMEKCTFCVQRIQTARQPAKDESRDIRSDEVQTACQQTCPTRAITFGNLKETGSDVVKKGGDKKRSYHALMELNTRPAITYLKKVKRGEVKG
jgi:Fe-S-cluster-containing dehydrogenase component